MAAGDLVIKEFQIELWRSDTDRLLMGAATNYHFLTVTGMDMMTLRNTDFERMANHGDVPSGRETMQARTIRMNMAVKGADKAATVLLMDALGKAFRPAPDTLVTATIKWYGRDLVLTTGRPRRMEWSYDGDWIQGGVLRPTAEFRAFDPIFYDYGLSTSIITIGAGSTSSTGGGQNDGNIPVQPLLSIAGPTVNPRILNTTDAGKTIRIDVTLAGGDTLLVDVYNRKVLLNGVDRYDLVRSDNQWWSLLPGSNSITYSRTGTSGSSAMTMTWRSGWNGL